MRPHGRTVLLGFASVLFQLLSQRDCLYCGLWDAPGSLVLVVLNLSSAGLALGMFLGAKYRTFFSRRERWLPFFLGTLILLAHFAIQGSSNLDGLTSAAAILGLLPVFLLLGIELAVCAPANAAAFLWSLSLGTVAGVLAYNYAAVYLPFSTSFALLSVLVVLTAASRRALPQSAAFILVAALIGAASFPVLGGDVVGRYFTPFGVIEIHDDGFIDVDKAGGGAATHIAPAGDLTRVEEQARVPYAIHKPGRVLVIGTGGGQDLAAALYYGAKSVTGIELNRSLLDLMRHRFAPQSNGLFLDPRVHIIEDEARHALRSLDERFDLIVVQRPWTRYIVEHFVHAPSDFLLTPNAFREYWKRLTPDGLLFLSLPMNLDEVCSPAALARALPQGFPLETFEGHMAVLGLTVQNQFRQRRPRLMCMLLVSKAGFAAKDRITLSGLGGTGLQFPTRTVPEFPASRPARAAGDSEEHPGWERWGNRIPRLLALFAAALLALGLGIKFGVKPLPTDFPAPAYIGLGIAYFWLEARLLMRASFFMGDLNLAYELVVCTFTFFGGLGYLHAARLRRGRDALVPTLLAMILLAADAHFSILGDRSPGVWTERMLVVGFCAALGYLAAFPFGFLMSRDRRATNAFAWDSLGMFIGYPAVPLILNSMPVLLAYGAALLYLSIAGWIFRTDDPTLS